MLGKKNKLLIMEHKNRKKPYESERSDWLHILKHDLVVPMNQRQFEWNGKDLKTFIEDIVHIFDSDYVEKMGSIIVYNTPEGTKEIWDGQQRTTAIILLLHAISSQLYQISNNTSSIHNPTKKDESFKMADDISKLIKAGPFAKCKTIEQDDFYREYLIRYGLSDVTRPSIYYHNVDDQNAMSHIFNRLYESYHKYCECIYHEDNEIDDSDANDDENEEDNVSISTEYKCTKDSVQCQYSSKNIQSFLKHLSSSHNVNEKIDLSISNSKIYDAYDYIYSKLMEFKYEHNKLYELAIFIAQDIDIQLFKSNDVNYVVKIFDWENNRGRRVNDLDLVKHTVLTAIPPQFRKKCYDDWVRLKNVSFEKNQKLNMYPDLGDKLFDVALDIYAIKYKDSKKIEMHEKSKIYEKYSANLVDPNNGGKPTIQTYTNLLRFFQIVGELHGIYANIKVDKYGRLINTTRRVTIPWAAYSYVMLPIFYIRKENKAGISVCLEIFLKWYFRNINNKMVSLSHLNICHKLLNITNKVINDNTFNYHLELTKELNSGICKLEYIKKLCDLDLKKVNAVRTTYLLYFIETKLNTDNHTVALDNTLEHIIPKCLDKDPKSNDFAYIHSLGNLTLLEGKNSKTNNHKGNSSIQNKSYQEKLESYLKSSCLITRNLGSHFPRFTEKEVALRTYQLATHLEAFTSM